MRTRRRGLIYSLAGVKEVQLNEKMEGRVLDPNPILNDCVQSNETRCVGHQMALVRQVRNWSNTPARQSCSHGLIRGLLFGAKFIPMSFETDFLHQWDSSAVASGQIKTLHDSGNRAYLQRARLRPPSIRRTYLHSKIPAQYCECADKTRTRSMIDRHTDQESGCRILVQQK